MNAILIKKINKLTDKAEITADRFINSWKMKLTAVLIGFLITAVLFITAFYNISQFYDEYRVIFLNPIEIKINPPFKFERRITAKKYQKPQEGAKNEQISRFPNGFEEAYEKVWLMESGKGTNKTGLNGYCIGQNKINEIGFAPFDKYCFENQEEQKDMFFTWLTNRINKVKMPYCDTIDQCLRIYSNGSYGLD